MPATIGIDLGASKCCVASVHDGKLAVLPNARGDKTTPSFVAFNDRRCLVGSDAKDQAPLNPKNTVYGIKSILGRTFSDPVVRNYARFSSAKVTNVQGQPIINVGYRDRYMSISPLLIAAMQILDMKQQAEREVGEVGGAVVSVPAYFGNSQREAIVAACHIAGLELLDLISEPIATALTYRENRGSISKQETILVFDMGAAKLDVSVIRVSEQEVKVLAVCGDDTFGGDKLNEILMEYVDDKFEDVNNTSLFENERAMFKLKLACEEIKKKLTLLPSHKVHQESVLNQKDLVVCVTKKKFERLFAKKFSPDLKAILDSVLCSAGLSKSDINEVVVVGGSSRVPVIQTILSRYFGKKELNKTVNADESVATGAAILANELAKEEQHRSFVLHELVRVPVMDCSRGMFDFHKYVPSYPGIRFSVAVERTLSAGSTEREQTCLCPEKFGIVKIKEVVVKKPATDNEKQEKTITIIDEAEVGRSKSQLESFEKDRIQLENDEKAQNDLEGYCYSVIEAIERFKTFCSEIDKVKDLSQAVLDWVEKNDRATVEECKKQGDCLRETGRKFNEDFKKEIENYLAVIKAFERTNEETSEDVDASNEKTSTEEERTLETEKADRVETETVCAVCRKLESEEAEAKEEEIEVARRTAELQDLKQKKLAVLQEIDQLNLEKKHETDKKELADQRETEEDKLIEKHDAEKKKQEVKNTNLVKQQEAENKKLANQLEALEKKQEAENKKLAERQETEKKKLAEQQEAKEKKLEAEMKKLAEQQEEKEKDLAESHRVETENHKGDKNNLAKEQDAREIKLAEQLEKEKKKLAEEQEKQRKKMTKDKEAVIEKMETEKKKLAAQHQTERKKLEDEKKKVVEQQEAEKTKRETNMNRLVNQQKIEIEQLEKKEEAAKKQLAERQEAEKKRLAEKQEGEKKKLAEQQESERKKRLAEQQEAERKKKLAEQQEAERKKRLAEQQEAERKKRLAEQQEAERKKKLAEQQEAERKKKLAEQQEAERKKRLAEQQEADGKKKLAELQEEAERKKRLAEQQEAEKKKKLAEQQEADRKKKLAEQQEEAERKKRLAEQQEDAERKKRLAEHREEAERKKRLAEQQEEAERKKRLAEQQEEAERKKRLAEQQEEAERKKKLAEQQEAEKKKREDEENEKRLAPEIKSNGVHETKISVSENENAGQSSLPSSLSNGSELQSNLSKPRSHGSKPQSNASEPQSFPRSGSTAFLDPRQSTSHTFPEKDYTASLYRFGGAPVHPEPSSVAGLAVTQQENSASTASQLNDSSGAPNSSLRCSQTQQTLRTGGSPPGELSVSGVSDPAKSVDSVSPSSDSGIHSDATSPSSSLTSLELGSESDSRQDVASHVDLDSDTSPGDANARDTVLDSSPKGINAQISVTSSSQETLNEKVKKTGVSKSINSVSESQDKLKNKGDGENGEKRNCNLN